MNTQFEHAQARDSEHWEQLVAEHQQAVFRLAYLLLADAHEAEDVAQETFLRAFRSWERFDASKPARPWLLRITANLAANRRRSFARAVAALTRFGSANNDQAPDIASTTQRQMEAHELWHTVRRLRANDQQIIYLRYFLDLSEAEMAQTLEIAPGTVKSRLHRALAKLRHVVEREFPTLRDRSEL